MKTLCYKNLMSKAGLFTIEHFILRHNVTKEKAELSSKKSCCDDFCDERTDFLSEET